MSAHTPGPWVLIREGGRDNSAIATIEPKPDTMEGPNYWTVASTNGRRAEWVANARLIVAAPDLLSACKGAEQWLEGWASAEPYLSVIKAAIAKATEVSQ